MVFILSDKTLKNYEEIAEENKKQDVSVTVVKAAPTINLTANVSGNSVNKTITLSAEVEGKDGAAEPTSSVKFSYENGGNFIELDTVTLDKGKATNNRIHRLRAYL